MHTNAHARTHTHTGVETARACRTWADCLQAHGDPGAHAHNSRGKQADVIFITGSTDLKMPSSAGAIALQGCGVCESYSHSNKFSYPMRHDLMQRDLSQKTQAQNRGRGGGGGCSRSSTRILSTRPLKRSTLYPRSAHRLKMRYCSLW